MDGFTKMVKMKTGGSVSEAKEKMCSGGASKKYKTGGKVHDDEAQDKILIKKMILKEDKEEKPELKLKKGGRATKAVGTVKKFSAGSDVEKEKSKPAGEKDPIVKVKPTGNKKAAAPSKAAVKPKEVKKFSTGGGTGPVPPEVLAQIMLAQKLKNQAPMGQSPMGQSPMGQAPIPTPPEFNGFRNFQERNPNSPGGMNPADIEKLLQSRQFQGASGNFTDR
jgi:hypothetical protein